MYQDKPSVYRYIRDKTKFMSLQNVQTRTKDLLHTERHIIPLRYEREHIGDICGSYKVYICCVGHSRRVVLSGW
jgi:hypothetical protein